MAICHFYFKYDDRECQSGEQIASDLLKQLVYQSGILPIGLEKLYVDSKTGLAPKLSVITDLLISSCSAFYSTFVFLDGLDECTDEQQSEVIVLVKRLSSSGIRVLLTSQPQLIPLVSTFGTFVSIEIVAKKEDLEAYVRQRVESARNNTALGETLVNELIAGAEGM